MKRALILASFAALLPLTAHAAKPHPATTDPNCRLTGTSVGDPLVITGGGYTPGAYVGIAIDWPGTTTTGGTTAVADASGDITLDTYAYEAGTYTVRTYDGNPDENVTPPSATCTGSFS